MHASANIELSLTIADDRDHAHLNLCNTKTGDRVSVCLDQASIDTLTLGLAATRAKLASAGPAGRPVRVHMFADRWTYSCQVHPDAGADLWTTQPAASDAASAHLATHHAQGARP